MKVRDRKIGKMVSVLEAKCLKRHCYWPRQDPGSFVQGRGYKSYGDSRDKEWICGTRDIHGCPSDKDKNMCLIQRINDLLDSEIEYVHNDEFCGPDADAILDIQIPRSTNKCWKPPKDFPGSLATLCGTALLTAQQERDLFRKFNYLKYLANCYCAKLDPNKPDKKLLETIEWLLAEAEKIRNYIVTANTRLAVRIARKFVGRYNFEDALSEALLSILLCVNRFNYRFGFRFSTYAYRAISRNISKEIAVKAKDDSRFMTGQEDLCGLAADTRSSLVEDIQYDLQRKRMLEIFNELDERTQIILRERYLAFTATTLQELGHSLSISKERVRQLEQKGIAKLRKLARLRK